MREKAQDPVASRLRMMASLAGRDDVIQVPFRQYKGIDVIDEVFLFLDCGVMVTMRMIRKIHTFKGLQHLFIQINYFLFILQRKKIKLALQ